jgi:hypothetical protein
MISRATASPWYIYTARVQLAGFRDRPCTRHHSNMPLFPYLLRVIHMAHEFRCPNAPLRVTCASRVILCRVARVESFAPM